MNDAAHLRVRVWVEDAWDTVEFSAPPEWTVAQLKRQALDAATVSASDLAGYEVKLRGASVLDEDVTLRELRVTDRAPFTVLSTRRRPVR